MRHLRRQGNRAEKTPRMRHSSKPFEMKNGERSLEFYHKFRDQFSVYKMDFGLYLEFLKLLLSFEGNQHLFSQTNLRTFTTAQRCMKEKKGIQLRLDFVGF